MGLDKPEQSPNAEPQLSGINYWVHQAIKETYSRFGNGIDQNSAGEEHRSLAVKALDFLQIPPYGAYYAAYQVARGINWVGDQLGTPGRVVSHGIAMTLTPIQAGGLLANELLGIGILALNDGKANMYQDLYGTIVPHFAWSNAPRVYLPGIHHDGKIDFEW